MDFIDNLGYLALGSRLRRLSDAILLQGQRIYQYSEIDFESKWFPVFHLLLDKGPLGIMDIANELNISHPYVIQLVKGLEKNNLVTNLTDAADGRKRSIELTDQGRKTGERMLMLWKDIETAVSSAAQETNHDLLNALRLMESALDHRDLFDRFKTVRASRLMDHIEIVGYKSEYASFFADLNQEWLEKYFHVEAIDKKVLGKPYESIIKPGGTVLFAKYDDQIVGTCALKRNKNDQYELTKMAVTEKVQGLQIGKKLGMAIIADARQRNLPMIYLETNSMLKPAISLYKKLGFVEKKAPYKSDYDRSDIYMELKL